MSNTSSNLRTRSPEPLAIIGLGCRFPGDANDWQQYWNLLESGTDAISVTPESRWNLQKFYAPNSVKPGKTQSKWGGYVSDIEKFDPQLFGISPREAAVMDPQQRMLLEVAYRAMEDAGQPTEKVSGKPVSVFVGISSFDYAVAGLSFQDRGVINAYSNTGGSSSIAANRISYCFDLRGPSVAVDTACSSSLVAIHMACESIWRGEASMALAGGVNALIMPDFYVAFSQLGVLSPDGRCKTFDARANGYVRSEGAGMIMLKPLSAAIRDRDAIYSVIRATALNQDGRTPGMTVPSQDAQEQLLRSACAKASINPASIQYVEAHGTGTPVGDPIETRALGAVLGQGRDQGRCRIGSVKTNIGHLEAGAGIASVIKVALALHHKRIPAHLNFNSVNPEIDLDALKLEIPLQSQDWDSETPRLAGVNGFGYGGANAHIILEEAPRESVSPTFIAASEPTRDKAEETAAPTLLPLSARSKSALTTFAGNVAQWLENNPAVQLPEVAGFLAHRRSHQDYRATVCASSTEEMVAELRTFAASNPEELADDFGSAKVSKGPVFVCSGQGPQWWAMGRGLLKYSPAFRTVIKRCDSEFAKYGNWSLLEELTRSESESRMQKTSIAQPSIFAIQVALAAVWESWGIKPSAIVGHSVGEIASAYLSGALSWEDACCVAFHRGRTMDLATSHGAMVAAGLSPDEVPEWIRGMEDVVGIAAINGPSSVTISGDKDAIHKLASGLEEAGIFCRRLAVEYAFHSPQMAPVKDELLRSLSHIRPQKTHTPLVSTVTGLPSDGTDFGAEYWWQNVRQAVRFSDAMTCLAEEGFGIAVEIGPHPVLAYAINECFQAQGKSVRSVASLNRQQDDLLCISKSLGQLYSLGFSINWSGFYNQPTRKLTLPTYPFQNQTCWSESLESQTTRSAEIAHPLLGERSDSPTPTWQSRIDLKLQAFLSGHKVRGGCIYPAAAMLETAIAASCDVNENEVARVEGIQLLNPCSLTEGRPQWQQTSFDSDRRAIEIAVRDCEEVEWSTLAQCNLSKNYASNATEIEARFQGELPNIQSRCSEPFAKQRLYDYCAEIGLDYSGVFRGIQSGVRTTGECLAEVTLTPQEGPSDYRLHPALLDSCFHSMIAADPNFDHTVDGLYLPVSIRELCYYARPTAKVTVHTRMKSKSKRLMICDLDIFDERGHLCVTIRDFESMRVAGGKTPEATEDLIYGYEWVVQPLESNENIEQGSPSQWLLFMDESGLSKELAARLRARGSEVQEVYRSVSKVAQTRSDFFQVDPEAPESFDELFSKLGKSMPSNIVYLWGLDTPETAELNCESLDKSTHLTSLAPLHLVQAWERLPEGTTAELCIVTSGAQSQDGAPEATKVAQGPLVGFGRVVVSEYSKLQTKLVDIPSKISPKDIEDLLQELHASDDEDEILWRNSTRFAHRFTAQAGKPASSFAAENFACQLRVGESSGVEELHYSTKPTIDLADGEIEIEVLASGLNFSDVMKALDLYPGLPDGPVALGAECSGRVSRVGPNSQWNVGDEVIAVAPGSFSTHVTVNGSLVARKPANLDFSQAAALTIAFLTADYALNECARLREGDSVLIHSASGGVGLAAMQLAKLAGVRIFATAGTDEKRKLVRDLGADVVMDSRSLAFADQTLSATNGDGVDAVLNSLPGEAIAKGISVLKTGGRFLEIGKRDIYGNSPLDLYPFRNNLAMFAIDLDQMFKEQPERMGQMLRQLSTRFEAGELTPLPVKNYDSSETIDAYKFMQQGKHIGKVVVNYDERPEQIQTGDYLPISFDSSATYWIVGGLGGFGLQITRWMVEQGARHLVLSGRSKTLRPEADTAIAELRELGAQITILPADATKPDELSKVAHAIYTELPPLKGVIHTAMVLEDKLLVDLDRETLERVLRPKVLGGWNLHQITRGLALDHFVLFSSLSSVFGHAGQANYSAANALLDSLAYFRRSQGLPATVMNWGHLGEVGYLAEREQLGQRLERQGVLSFTVKQATDCLEYALQTAAIQLSVLRMDWSVWRGLGITNRVSPRFAHLLRSTGETSVDSEELASAATLRSAEPTHRLAMVDRLVRSKAGTLLGIPADQIAADRALLEMGLDSLMAVEMRNWIETQMEINLPISALMRSESLEQVVGIISDTIGEAGDSIDTASPEEPAAQTNAETTGASETTSDAEQLLQQLPNLGNDEVDDLLSQLLREQQSS